MVAWSRLLKVAMDQYVLRGNSSTPVFASGSREGWWQDIAINGGVIVDKMRKPGESMIGLLS